MWQTLYCNRTTRTVPIDKEDSEVQVLTESEVQTFVNLTKTVENNADCEVQEVTETENEKDISTRHETMAQDKHATTESDTTESTPDIVIFRSPVTEAEQQQLLEEDETVTTDVVLDERIEASATSLTRKGKTYTGVVRVEETEKQDKASDSEDDIPVATLLRQEKGMPLSLQQIQDCKEGPVEERAIGVTIAKIFDGVEYRGKIDVFRKARQRIYYHVTYSDGDEEELLQAELRDGYILGLSAEIEAQWRKYKAQTEDPNIDGKSGDEASEDEGSQYDNTDYNEEVRQKRKQRDGKTKRTAKKKQIALSEVVLPQSGDKTVVAEAFQNLDDNQKQLVADKVNRKTKKVQCSYFVLQ
jgi:hypothetical protein